MLASGVATELAWQSLLRELNDGTLVSGLKATVDAARPPLPVGKDGSERIFAGVWSDLRYGARLLLKNPGFATVAILSLALGIGANTTIFQLLDAVRLRTLPVKAPQQLARVQKFSPSLLQREISTRQCRPHRPPLESVARTATGISEIAAWSPFRYNLGQGGEAYYANALLVSGDFFNVLGVQPLLGRLISPVDDYRGCGAQGVAELRLLAARVWWACRRYRQQTHAGWPSFPDHRRRACQLFGLEVGQNFDIALASAASLSFPPRQPDGRSLLMVDRGDRALETGLDTGTRFRSTRRDLSGDFRGNRT